MKRNKVVLFDGVCLFCEGWVNFVLDNAGKDKIFFIPLQKVELTDSSKEIIKKFGGEADSILCISENEPLKVKSDASLSVMSTLKFPFGIFAKIALVVPRFLRNFVYDFIGKRRYNIWGKRDFCIVPEGERGKSFVNKNNELPAELAKKCANYFRFI